MEVFSTIFAPISTPDLGPESIAINGTPFSSLSFIGANGEPVLIDGVLDLFSMPVLAYSMRDLGKARTPIISIGDTGTQTSDTWVIQLRRDSDDNHKSFTASQVIDGTLSTWVGADDAFITILYDQSSNGNNAVQGIAVNQPQLVDDGVRYSLGLKFDGADTFLTLTNSLMLSDGTMHVVSKLDPAAARQTLFGGLTNMYIPVAQSGSIRDGMYLKSDVLSHHLNGQPAIATGTRGDAFDLWTSTTEQLLTLTGVTTDFPIQDVGRGAGTTSSWDAGGFVNEIIFYSDDQSTNRVGIETNINDHYNIY